MSRGRLAKIALLLMDDIDDLPREEEDEEPMTPLNE